MSIRGPTQLQKVHDLYLAMSVDCGFSTFLLPSPAVGPGYSHSDLRDLSISNIFPPLSPLPIPTPILISHRHLHSPSSLPISNLHLSTPSPPSLRIIFRQFFDGQTTSILIIIIPLAGFAYKYTHCNRFVVF